MKGYDRQGNLIKTDEGTSTVNVAKEAGFTFNKGFGAFFNLSLNDSGLNPGIVKELENGLLLELAYDSKEKNTSKMTVKNIVKVSYSVDLSDYKTLGPKITRA